MKKDAKMYFQTQNNWKLDQKYRTRNVNRSRIAVISAFTWNVTKQYDYNLNRYNLYYYE